MSVHVLTAAMQPATRYRVGGIDMTIWIRHSPRQPLFARCCKRRRIAKNLVVQSYYDGDRFTCRRGKGCKS